MKVGLCLGGGGARGYAHIGAIRALMEGGIKIDIVNGTSIGAVMGGAYALYKDTGKMTELMEQIVGSVNINYYNLFRQPADRRSFLRKWLEEAACNIASLRRSIQSNRNNIKALRLIFEEHRFEDTIIPFSAVAVDIIAGKTVVIKRGKLVDGILASASIPGIFAPIARGKKLLVDGYVLANIPIRELRQEGADFIISIELGTTLDHNYKNGMDLLNYIEELKQKRMERWAIAESDFHIRIKMPNFDSSRFDNNLELTECGYRTVKKVIPRLLRELKEANV
jgi:NTE family protein